VIESNIFCPVFTLFHLRVTGNKACAAWKRRKLLLSQGKCLRDKGQWEFPSPELNRWVPGQEGHSVTKSHPDHLGNRNIFAMWCFRHLPWHLWSDHHLFHLVWLKWTPYPQGQATSPIGCSPLPRVITLSLLLVQQQNPSLVTTTSWNLQTVPLYTWSGI
jgi:hypothetical protein